MSEEEAETGKKPDACARWFYAFEDSWQAFNDDDDARLEERWTLLREKGKLPNQNEEKDNERKSAARPQLARPASGVDTIRSALFGEVQESKKAKEEAAQQKAVDDDKQKDTETKQPKRDEDGRVIVSRHLDPDESAEERVAKVEVMEDRLFDVDLETMELYPVFWKGVLLRVVRATWFYLSGDGGFAPIPYDEALSNDLNEAFEKAQPWKQTQPISATDAEKNGAGTPANDTLYNLASMEGNGRIHFENESSGRVFTQDFSGKVLSVLGGSLVIRGWHETAERSKALRNTSIFSASRMPWAGGQSQVDGDDDDDQKAPRGSKRAGKHQGAATIPGHPRQTDDNAGHASNQAQQAEENQGWLGRLWPSTDSLMNPRVSLLRSIGWSKEDATQEGQRAGRQANTEEALRKEGDDQGDAPKDEDDDVGSVVDDADEDESARPESIQDDRKDEPPELVLAIHGIGQKLTDDFDAIDFVYDIEKLRNLSKKCAEDAAIRRISHGKRAQFLPICWRKELSFDDKEARDGNDNVYGLQDVSNDATIPMVRNIISKVVLDVPYYLSRHKRTMVEAVMTELNRVYRLFVRRNPDFERRGGRVSLICHSLGSALAADILSDQPTHVAPLADRSEDEQRSNAQLVFNVRNLFFVGSPNGFFFHLHGAQMIARRGTQRTKAMSDDATRDGQGTYGCMAAESVYNCYNATDPVAFQLSATVDREYARMLRPISIPDAVPALLDALAEPRLSLSKYFDLVHPFPSGAGEKVGKGDAPEQEASNKLAQHPGAAVHGPTSSGTHSPVPGAKDRHSSADEIGKPVLIEEGSQQKVRHLTSKLHAESNNKKPSSSSSSSSFDLARLQRAERRFRALNPHGCLDFIYHSGGVNQYLDMLSAHVSYWTSKTFATFILTQLLTDFSHDGVAPTIVPRLVTEPDALEDGDEASKDDDQSKQDTDKQEAS